MISINNLEIGDPCMMGEVVGRIIAAAEGCEWREINGKLVPSQVIFSSPHGTMVKTGRFHLQPITEEGMSRLEEYEKDAVKQTGIMYRGEWPSKNKE